MQEATTTPNAGGRVGSPPALPGAGHRGRIWEPSQGSHQSKPRIEVVDWLRGGAVVLMILAHGMDAWMLPGAKTGDAYALIRVASGIPARLFLLLVGVSAAIQFEAGIRKGQSTGEMRGRIAKRGLLVLGLAYVFRLQEFVLSRFYGGWETVFKIDILNAIGACMLVVALVSTPRNGQRQIVPSLVLGSLFLGLGTVIGPAHFPSWLPAPLTSYLGGQRPMAWFSLFPWGAWAMAGVAVGHLWLDASRDPRRLGRCFLWTFLAGAAMTGTVTIIRLISPTVILYPTDVIRQMGPGIFFHRLGLIGMLAGFFSMLRQFGRTSLLIYWVHIELCYGSVVYALRGRFHMGMALLLVALLSLVMFGLSVVRTHIVPPATFWLRSRFRKARPA
jgi:uncharacterized membrane protein